MVIWATPARPLVCPRGLYILPKKGTVYEFWNFQFLISRKSFGIFDFVATKGCEITFWNIPTILVYYFLRTELFFDIFTSIKRFLWHFWLFFVKILEKQIANTKVFPPLSPKGHVRSKRSFKRHFIWPFFKYFLNFATKCLRKKRQISRLKRPNKKRRKKW